MDCRELVAGSRLFLPIEAPGGLLSVGDLHAAQGDGEVGGSAIECPAERITLRCLVHSDKPCASPYAKTPAGFVTLGFGPNLDDATAMALSSLLDALTLQWNVTRSKALALASSCVHLRITQIANGTVGAHALLPTEALRSN